MRRFVFPSGKRNLQRLTRSAVRPVAEAVEMRMLLSAVTPSATTVLLTYTITGEVAQDLNNNGTLDGGDTPLANQTVFVDVDGTGVYDPLDDYAAPTDTLGTYTLVVPSAGTYAIRVVPQTGLEVVPTSPGLAPLLVDSSTNSNGPILEVPAATVNGTVFNDANANGIRDAGEVGLPDRQVYADVNHNGVFDAADPSTTTDSSGRYTLENLPTTGTTAIRLIGQTGTTLTTPASGEHDLTLTIGQTVNDVDFGTTGPDLSATLLTTPTLQSLLIGGIAAKKTLAVRISNTGNVAVNSLVGVTIWASTDTTLDSSDNIIGNVLGRPTSLKPGQSKIIRVHYGAPVNITTGAYFVLAQVNSSAADNNPSNDVSASGTKVNVYRPFNDLGIQYLPYPNGPTFNVDPGKSFSVPVMVTNDGNVPYTGTITLQLYQSVTPTFQAPDMVLTGDGQALNRNPNLKIKLLPHQSKVVSIFVPNVIQRGVYYLLTLLTENNPLGDVSTANNEAIAPTTTYFH